MCGVVKPWARRSAVVVAGAAAVVAAGVTPAAAAAAGTVSCRYTFIAWNNGFSANLVIANAGPTINGWTVRWTFADPTSGIVGWNALIRQQSSLVTAANLPWNAVLPTGQVTSFGWSATAAATSTPTDITVNGVPC